MIHTRGQLPPQPQMTMRQKDEVEQMTETTLEANVEEDAEARRRKRKARTRTESLGHGMTLSDCVTVEPTHQNSLQRSAASVTGATAATICGSILRMEGGKISILLMANVRSGRYMVPVMLDGNADSCQAIQRKLREKMAGWS